MLKKKDSFSSRFFSSRKRGLLSKQTNNIPPLKQISNKEYISHVKFPQFSSPISP
jgi:hypothetical protein